MVRVVGRRDTMGRLEMVLEMVAQAEEVMVV